jgi:3-hydroxyisobutyrate dehydrogenase
MPHIKAFAANVVYLGPVGSGHAVKAVNNACNVSNLLCLHEGLLALKKMGVNPSAALEVINKSSGRSLMSQARVPEEVVTGDFNYGFKLGLMAKDVGIATDILDKYFPNAKIYRNTAKMHLDAMAAGTVTFDSDYTEIVKHQEVQAGVQLRKEPEPESDADEEPAKTGLPNEEQLAALSAQLQAVLNENALLRADLQSVKAADRPSA